MAGFLQMRHDNNLHKMPHVQAVCRWVKADIKGDFLLIEQLFDFVLMRGLCNQTSCLQFFINSHKISS
jgi:hypothetical protein